MSAITRMFHWLGGTSLLVLQALRQAVRRPFEFRAILQQLDQIGVRSLGIVTITALFAGMVLALQTAHALEQYGAVGRLGQVVAVSLVREMGPVLTALVVSGRVDGNVAAARLIRVDAGGRVKGDIEARHVSLMNGAKVQGKILTLEIWKPARVRRTTTG